MVLKQISQLETFSLNLRLFSEFVMILQLLILMAILQIVIIIIELWNKQTWTEIYFWTYMWHC